jgi:micrococcal nuclease
MIKHVSQSIYVYKCTLDRVIDGDTIEAYIDLGFKIRWKTVIRFKGFDAYETRGVTADPIGKQAKEFLTSMLDRYGPDFYLQSDRDEIAIYNRVAGRLYLEMSEGKNGMKSFIDVIETLRRCGFEKGSTPMSSAEMVTRDAMDIMELVA